MLVDVDDAVPVTPDVDALSTCHVPRCDLELGNAGDDLGQQRALQADEKVALLLIEVVSALVQGGDRLGVALCVSASSDQASDDQRGNPCQQQASDGQSEREELAQWAPQVPSGRRHQGEHRVAERHCGP
jgi:hypothetical protein